MAGRTGQRVTVTIRPQDYALLLKMSLAMGIRPGDLVRNMTQQFLDGIREMFEGIDENDSKDVVMRRMYRSALHKMAEMMEETEES